MALLAQELGSLGVDKDQDNHRQGERKRGNDKFQRFGKIDSDMDPNQDDSMEDCLGKGSPENYNEYGNGDMVPPLAAFHPELGHISMSSNHVV